jgi:hypothetical protein
MLVHCSRTHEDATLPHTVTQVLRRHTDSLMAVPGVVGTAEGSCAGKPCILVLVERSTAELRKRIPSELEGVPVEIRETGRVTAETPPAAPHRR